jgi:hypothetical protein
MFILILNKDRESSVFAVSESEDRLIDLAKEENLDVDIWIEPDDGPSRLIFHGDSDSDTWFDIESVKVI